MGNSEVGHNALGAGRIFTQGCVVYLDGFDSDNLFCHWEEFSVAIPFAERDVASPLSRKMRA